MIISLYGNGGGYPRPGVVIHQGEILVLEVEDGLDLGIDQHLRKGPRLAGELEVNLLEVIGVDMGVACRVDELARLQAADLGYHHREEGVGGYIERHSEESVGTSLVELAGQFPVCNVKLEQAMARRESHFVNFRYIPGTDKHPP